MSCCVQIFMSCVLIWKHKKHPMSRTCAGWCLFQQFLHMDIADMWNWDSFKSTQICPSKIRKYSLRFDSTKHTTLQCGYFSQYKLRTCYDKWQLFHFLTHLMTLWWHIMRWLVITLVITLVMTGDSLVMTLTTIGEGLMMILVMIMMALITFVTTLTTLDNSDNLLPVAHA